MITPPQPTPRYHDVVSKDKLIEQQAARPTEPHCSRAIGCRFGRQASSPNPLACVPAIILNSSNHRPPTIVAPRTYQVSIGACTRVPVPVQRCSRKCNTMYNVCMRKQASFGDLLTSENRDSPPHHESIGMHPGYFLLRSFFEHTARGTHGDKTAHIRWPRVCACVRLWRMSKKSSQDGPGCLCASLLLSSRRIHGLHRCLLALCRAGSGSQTSCTTISRSRTQPCFGLSQPGQTNDHLASQRGGYGKRHAATLGSIGLSKGPEG
ncbi:hypothetical protein K491DRAFT_261307 [Lophiostoma macrostomum CBS 122681]|uniref:Uncharacterized protein n=1 Tax=Lophiostoma macrostomum CBS 122681 TaxID=1314788 RepID=A0A6A6SM87_9PLEO|nr:hypothetical protein K491DRAFT_261307 [Lophiostoma macrostomum CBS 122681]